ncbi:NAD(P)-dependent oxidoreductase [Ramlibacter albus]|uniref:SDR family oxidoreductase n=1 Tax=Ramlibacter albus TaxID=2079448 RepID=A0A923M420_9BURK|nr:SDR family oxidoreductase [Ramlibacter albus]MBC5763560.1 SDR family oxidoreductase [Ramlibacter albus]
MKVLILGATGGTGRHLVTQALEQGHEVTVLVRNPAKLGELQPRVRAIQGSLPEGGEALQAAVRGQDAVISSLGLGNGTNPDGLMERSVPAIVAAMRSAGVKRLVHISAFGVGPTKGDVPLVPRLAQRLFLSKVFADKEAGERALPASGLDWTVVYPSVLTDGPKTAKIRYGEHLPLSGIPKISRADVAAFTLAQLTDKTYVGKGALVTS